MFVQTTDVNKNTRHFNLLYDKVPVVLSDGHQNWLTNTFDVLHDYNGEKQVVLVLKRLFETKKTQSLTKDITIRFF